jgi:hypothetical protein
MFTLKGSTILKDKGIPLALGSVKSNGANSVNGKWDSIHKCFVNDSCKKLMADNPIGLHFSNGKTHFCYF